MDSMADHSCQGNSLEEAIYDGQSNKREYAQRSTDDCSNLGLPESTTEQELCIKRSDIVGGGVHARRNDLQPEQDEGARGDHQRTDTQSGTTSQNGQGGEDTDDEFSGFSDSSLMLPELERNTNRSKARPKATPIPRAEYRETKARIKAERRARKNAKRYRKKKLHGPIAEGGHEKESLIYQG